jgi:DNA uptake protein ComE-like DNA-binding protein
LQQLSEIAKLKIPKNHRVGRDFRSRKEGFRIQINTQLLPASAKGLHGLGPALYMEDCMRGAGMRNRHFLSPFVLCVAALLSLAGCTWSGNSSSEDERAREQRTRDEVAKATERAKPALEEAGRKIGKAASEAADQAQAAAEGVREGWDRGGHHLVNVNTATEDELVELPGINRREARRITDGRPYEDKHQLVAKGVMSESAYGKIRDRITSK